MIGEATPANAPATFLYSIAPFLQSLHPYLNHHFFEHHGGAAAPPNPPAIESYFFDHHGCCPRYVLDLLPLIESSLVRSSWGRLPLLFSFVAPN